MGKHAKQICLVIATLGAGGAERVMSLLANEWAMRGKAVTIITLGPAGADHYELVTGVRRVGLDVLKTSSGKLDAVKTNIRRVKRLRSAIKNEQPDVVVSFMDATNVLTLLATQRMRVRVVVSERIDPRHYPIAPGWQWLRRKLYPRASAVVVQTEAVADWVRVFLPAEKVHVIPNPVSVPTSEGAGSPGTADKCSNVVPSQPFIAAMGRLDRQKGFDLLLQAFAALSNDLDLRLVILGEGREREALTIQAAQLGISNRVIMPGRLADPFPILSKAQVFVLSSRFEGYPNALLEAMALRLPVVSFSCPSGPADIIVDGENGLLVELLSPHELSKVIEKMVRDRELRERLGSAAASSMKRFSPSVIADEWERLFELLLKQ